jgi:hypothetical protein
VDLRDQSRVRLRLAGRRVASPVAGEDIDEGVVAAIGKTGAAVTVHCKVAVWRS